MKLPDRGSLNPDHLSHDTATYTWCLAVSSTSGRFLLEMTNCYYVAMGASLAVSLDPLGFLFL